MRNKVIPFPARTRVDLSTPAIACHYSRVNLRVGTQNYAIDVTCQAIPVGSGEAAPAPKFQLETGFLRLAQPAAVGDRIDGWRVCWLGGWDRSKVFFVVMVERIFVAPDKR